MLRKFFNRHFSKDKALITSLAKVLGFVPTRLHFYRRAFTHKSIQSLHKESDKRLKFNNERLEFLGDAIFGSVIAEYLFKKYPTQNEGFLTEMRSKMVNRRMLNHVAAQMDLDLFLRHFGATQIGQTMMGNALEAFVGAIYLDVGYIKTKQFIIRKILRRHINVHQLERINYNYKSQLLEYGQKFQKPITYKVLNRYRTKGNRERFKIAVLIGGEQFSTAEDYGKKSAEQNASRKALIKIGVLDEDI